MLKLLVVAVLVNSFFLSSGVYIDQYGNFNYNYDNIRYQPRSYINDNSNSEEDSEEYNYNPNNCNSCNSAGNCRSGCSCSYPNRYPNSYPAPGAGCGACAGPQCDGALDRFNDGILTSGLRLFKAYYDSSPSEPGAISPLGISFTLGALAIFSEGKTKQELYDFINLSNKEEIECVFNRINYELLNLPCNVEFYGAADFFGFKFTDEFKDVMLNIIGGAAVDVNNSRNASREESIIEGQVKLETLGKVTNIIKDNSVFNSSTELVRITGSYFSSPWEIEFELSQQITEFCVAPGRSVPGKFYTQTAVYEYALSQELNAQAVRIYYQERYFNILVVVPIVPFTDGKVLDIMLQDPTGWYKRLCGQLQPTKVEATLIAYNQETNADSRFLLIEGSDLETIYSGDTIQLKGVTENDENDGVSVAYDKNVIQIPSDGCPVQNLPPGPAVTFLANIPHFFFISITNTNTPVYFGYTNGPTNGPCLAPLSW